jgi:hypothetical protein
MRYLSLILLLTLFISCSESVENVPQKIDQLIAEDSYTQAIELLNDTEASEVENLDRLKEKTYLNYGLFLEYRGSENSTMRDRMTSALEQYIKVLNINPKNQKARQEIQQIMGIYSTMPEKSPGEEILADLRELGFNY